MKTNWLKRLLGRNRYDKFIKVFRLIFVTLPICAMLLGTGYGGHAAKVWYTSGPCDRLDIADLNPFDYQHEEALTDQELACLIVQSRFPSSEWEWLFQTVYCESSKKPYATKRVGKVVHHGLTMISDLNLKLLGIVDYRILYNPVRNIDFAYELWKLRGRQPWGTDSTKATCMNDGPNMDGKDEDGPHKGKLFRDGWGWAEPTFALYFESRFVRKYHELKVIIKENVASI